MATLLRLRKWGTSGHQMTSVVALWLAVSLSVLKMASGNGEAETPTTAVPNSFQYKEYVYNTEQLCPDLQESVAGKDIDTANYPYKSVFRFMDHIESSSLPYEDSPCILEANGPQRVLTTALIEAIHVDTRPWNFSEAQSCEEHIKLRLPEPTFLKRSNVPEIICRVPKARVAPSEVSGSFYHPFLWQVQHGKLGISFSSFNMSLVHHPSHEQRHDNGSNSKAALPANHTTAVTSTTTTTTTSGHDEHTTNNHDRQGQQQQQHVVQHRNFWLEEDEEGNQFVQIVFTTRLGGMCSVRVQQYLVDAQRTLCEGAKQRNAFRLCGLYDCSEKETILRTLGFWRKRNDHERLDILLQSSEIPRWRRDEPSFMQILVSTLRALIMPLLFLTVFFVTRKLRLKLASRHVTHSSGLERRQWTFRQHECYLRNLVRQQMSETGGVESTSMLRPPLFLNHVVYDMPVEDYPGYEDLPPPYESIVQPPSYREATTTVKDGRSPSPTTTAPEGPTITDDEPRHGGGDEVTTAEDSVHLIATHSSHPHITTRGGFLT